MTTRPRRGRRKPRPISYREFRAGAAANACCAGDGSDTTTTLATIIARNAAGAKPAEMLEEVLDQGEGTPVHGVWHHSLIGEILLVCLRNAGYPITDELIDEVVDRGRQISGGSCGFMGVCGALNSAASAYAILLGSNPGRHRSAREAAGVLGPDGLPAGRDRGQPLLQEEQLHRVGGDRGGIRGPWLPPPGGRVCGPVPVLRLQRNL